MKSNQHNGAAPPFQPCLIFGQKLYPFWRSKRVEGLYQEKTVAQRANTHSLRR
jgi:hypothetical protein